MHNIKNLAYREIIKMNPEQKTIIVSGYSESERVKEAERLGVNGFIQKPYTISDMGPRIKAVFSDSKINL